MTRQYAANRRRAAGLLANTRVSVETIDPVPSGVTTKLIVARVNPGGSSLKDRRRQRATRAARRHDDGADDQLAWNVFRKTHEAGGRWRRR